MARGRWDEALRILEERRRAVGLDPAEEIQHALIHGIRGDLDEAAALLGKLAECSNRAVAAEAILRLADLRLSAGILPESIEALLARAQALGGGDPRLRGILAHIRSRFHWKRNEITRAAACVGEARKLLEEAGDEDDLSKVLDSEAMVHDHRGERELALSCYSLSLSKKALRRDLHGIGITLGNLGRFHLRNGRPAAALSCLRDDLRIASAMGDVGAQAVVGINIGQALTALGRLDEAKAVLTAALSLSREKGLCQHEAYALKDLGRLRFLEGAKEEGMELLGRALAIAPPGYARGQVLLSRGEALIEADDLQAARRDLEEARRCFATLEARGDEAAAIHGLSRISEKLEEWNDCLHLVEEGMEKVVTACFPLASLFEESYARLHAASQDRAIPRSIGPYRILERIGSGACGDVYAAFDERDGASRETVAVKVLRIEGQAEREELLRRFRRESDILAALSHPNIVRLLAAGEEPAPFMVEEYLPGGDLTALLAGGVPMSVEEAIRLLAGILRGIDALHAMGIVHRDLKPANILLREDGTPVIADFGIARMVSLTTITLQAMVLGSLAYMAPEGMRGETVDHRADIYAVGVIAYEILTGRLPHAGNTLGDVLRSVDEARFPSLGVLRPGLPHELVKVVDRCMQRDREARYGSAAEALRDIESCAGAGRPASSPVEEHGDRAQGAVFQARRAGQPRESKA